MTVHSSSRALAERAISAARVVLAVSSLVAVWLDPPDPGLFTSLAFSLHVAYVVYSTLLLSATWRSVGKTWVPVTTHVVDLAVFSALQLIMGPGSSYFVYFIFSTFCAAIRWGRRGTVTTSVAVISLYLLIVTTRQLYGPEPFDLNRIINRTMWLVVMTGMLVYLEGYQARLRGDIERLARWPALSGEPTPRELHRVIAHAARILAAKQAVVVWETEEEPAYHVAAWSESGLSMSTFAPSDLNPVVPPPLDDATFFCAGRACDASELLVATAPGSLVTRFGVPIHPRLLQLLDGSDLASAPFRTERVSGRIFFTGFGTPTAESVPLTHVIAREIGASLDQLYVARQLQEIAAREERLRVSRDLHDGVLQSLTGIRLEMRALARTPLDDGAMRARLLLLERALAIEQRELRFLIGGPSPAGARATSDDSLATRLDAIRERLVLEWKTPVSIRVSPDSQGCPTELAQAVPLMVHEAVVNALKHAHPTRVNVNVDSSSDRLRIVVSDDGQGFPFKGRFDHRALDETRNAPRSLFDRVTALGGKMSIDSSDAGSRIEMVVSL